MKNNYVRLLIYLHQAQLRCEKLAATLHPRHVLRMKSEIDRLRAHYERKYLARLSESVLEVMMARDAVMTVELQLAMLEHGCRPEPSPA